MKVASLFAGCGGLDLGFENAGFEVVYANDIDKAVWETYENNHGLEMDRRSLFDIKSEEIPDVDGLIGGPPCQSWSLAGAMRGANDERGQLFYEYIRVIKDKKPKFFVAENVPGIVSSTHLKEFKKIISLMEGLGYTVNYEILDARDYGVPQERKRVIVVGYSKDLGMRFSFPKPTHSKGANATFDGAPTKKWTTLIESIGDLPEALPALEKNQGNNSLEVPNHEYMNGGFSTIYMSRNRRRSWDQPSFTIQAGGRHAPLHPSSCKMCKVEPDKWVFENNSERHRRLSVRECARIQTFPDNFVFFYKNVSDGYKMIGNAVPVKLAEAVARKIAEDLQYHCPKEEIKQEAVFE